MAKHSVRDSAGTKQVGDAAQGLVGRGCALFSGLAHRREVGPLHRNKGASLVGKNQQQMQTTAALAAPEKGQTATFKRMAFAYDRRRGGKIFERGSVWSFPLIGSIMTG